MVVTTLGIPGSHEHGEDVQFCALLVAFDEQITERVREGGCPQCGGRLDRADYPRKPRGGGVSAAAEQWDRRFSLCCAREGCRRRATPPSVRYLGRRVYAELVVLVVCARALAAETSPAPGEPPAVPRRTVRRWLSWWRTAFTASALWTELRARLVPTLEPSRLPASLLERFALPSALWDAARLLAPLTTRSVPDGSRFVRLAM